MHVYCFRFPAQHTVQPTKSNLVAVANSGASKGGMMSSRMTGQGSERMNTSGRGAAKNGHARSPSTGVQCMHVCVCVCVCVHVFSLARLQVMMIFFACVYKMYQILHIYYAIEFLPTYVHVLCYRIF